jgi:hypothetical protein
MRFKSTIMLKNKIFFITIAFAFLQTHLALGQLFKKTSDSYSSVGIGAGTSHYFGDLSPYRSFYYAIYSNVRWNGTINYTAQLNSKFAARASVTYLRLFGNDATYGGKLADGKPGINQQRIRNLHFKNDMLEFAVMGLYSFRPLDMNRRKNDGLQWSPYVGLGIGLVSNNPMAKDRITDDFGGILRDKVQSGWTALRNADTEADKKYSSITPVIPLSLGIKTMLKPNLILGIEGSLRFTFSDYLDDVSTGRYSTDALSYRANEDYFPLTGKSRLESYMKATGYQAVGSLYPSVDAENHESRTGFRGSKRNDMYILTQVTLNYIIGSRVKCPPLGQ